MRARAVGLAAFAGAAAGGAALGYLAERRAMSAIDTDDAADLANPHAGARVEVRADDGTPLQAEVSGPLQPEAGGRQGAATLVLVHGLGLSQQTWHYQRRALESRYRVVSYDHRGHGRSGRAASGDYSMAALGRDLGSVVAACAPNGPLVLIGHSMGAMAILAAVSSAPSVYDRTVAVVLANSAGGSILGGAFRSTAAASLRTIQARLVGGRFARRMLDSNNPAARPATDLSLLLTRQFGLSTDASPEVVAFLETQLRAAPPTVLGGFAPHMTTADLADEAAALPVPALVIIGQRDRITPPRQGQRLVEILPDAEPVEIEGVGHTSMLEAPEQFTAAVERFAGEMLAQAA